MQAVLMDLDGVIYDSQSQIEGAVATVKWLNLNTIPYLFVTNTCSKPRAAIIEQLAAMQINVREEQILTPIVVAKQWLSSHDVEPIALYLEPESRCEFSEFKQIDQHAESGAGAVLISDIGQAWNYNSLNRALRLLMCEPKPVFVALGMSRYWQSGHGLALDVGPFVKALEFASSCKALVMGKPATSFFKTAAQLLNLDYSEVLMIGDDIISDINAAQQAGLRAAQVKTGKFRAADLESGIKPDYIIDSIADLPALWKKL